VIHIPRSRAQRTSSKESVLREDGNGVKEEDDDCGMVLARYVQEPGDSWTIEEFHEGSQAKEEGHAVHDRGRIERSNWLCPESAKQAVHIALQG
jgi:hypothetical protein